MRRDDSAINPSLPESRCWRSHKYTAASRPRSISSSPREYLLRSAAKESQGNPGWSVSTQDERLFRLFASPPARDRRERANIGEKWRGILSDGRGILTWLVGRDAGSLQGLKVRSVRAAISLEIFTHSSRQFARRQPHSRKPPIYSALFVAAFTSLRGPLEVSFPSGI